jgi:hypothetical protein
MSEAPKHISICWYDGWNVSYVGDEPNRSEEFCDENYRRADLPWLPEELVERIDEYMNGNEINAPIACAILRDIIAALEKKP